MWRQHRLLHSFPGTDQCSLSDHGLMIISPLLSILNPYSANYSMNVFIEATRYRTWRARFLTTVTHLVSSSLRDGARTRKVTFHGSKDVAVWDDTPTGTRPYSLIMLYVVNFLWSAGHGVNHSSVNLCQWCTTTIETRPLTWRHIRRDPCATFRHSPMCSLCSAVFFVLLRDLRMNASWSLTVERER